MPMVKTAGKVANRGSASARSRPRMRFPVTGRHPAKAAPEKTVNSSRRISIGFLSGEIVGLREHVVCRFDDLRVCFVRPLAADQIDEFVDDTDVRLLGIALQDGTEAVSAAG